MFSERSKRVARMIVHIFETGKPFGDPSALAVLDDGAGISYGMNQATHRSGSLLAVVNQYVTEFPQAPYASALREYLPRLQDASVKNVFRLSQDARLKDYLRLAGKVAEMKLAQEKVFNEKYLQPAIEACEGSKFILPLSLAVIYDSLNHGSFQLIRDRVNVPPTVADFEKLWISRYVLARDRWLESVPRLRKTDYRTDFFLAQIRKGNWNLAAPMDVHGFTLTDQIIG